MKWYTFVKDLFSYTDGWYTCPTCEGTGLEDVHPDSPLYATDCDDCKGTGQIYVPTHQEMG